MNIQKLDYFITIAETGNLTKAAQKLYVSQPSLSQYLKRLEASLGVELFDRTSSPLRLTYSGELYYKYALECRRREENIIKELSDIQEGEKGRLRLGLALWRGSALLPEVLPRYREQFPDVKIELMEGRSAMLRNALLNDEIDVAVMNIPRTMNYEDLVCDVFMEEHIMLAMPEKHPAAQEAIKLHKGKKGYPEIPVGVLNSLPVIMTKHGQNLTYETTRILELNQIKAEVLLETANLTTAINLVAEGMGCTFVPEQGAKICERKGKVSYFMIAESITECIWDLAAIYRKEAYINRITRSFIDALHRISGDRIEQSM